MNKKQIRYAVCSLYFISMYKDEYKLDSNLKEMEKTLGKIVKKHVRSEEETFTIVEEQYKIMNKITNGIDVDANLIGLATGFIFLLMEEEAFKGSVAMTMKRTSLQAYNVLEKQIIDSRELTSTNRLIRDIDEN